MQNTQQMNNPDIQNDFSYFRRTMSRRNLNMASVGVDYDEGKCVSTELANEMSLFYAEATPMLKTLTSATSSFVQKVKLFFEIILLISFRRAD